MLYASATEWREDGNYQTCELDEEQQAAQDTQLSANISFLGCQLVSVQNIPILLQDAGHMVRGCISVKCVSHSAPS